MFSIIILQPKNTYRNFPYFFVFLDSDDKASSQAKSIVELTVVSEITAVPEKDIVKKIAELCEVHAGLVKLFTADTIPDDITSQMGKKIEEHNREVRKLIMSVC